MLPLGSLNPLDQIPRPPDTVAVAMVSSAAGIVAADWPDGAQLVMIGSSAPVFLNMYSTGATVLAASTPGSTATPTEYVQPGTFRQIPGMSSSGPQSGGSTGYSVAAPSSGPIVLSFWRK